MMYVSPDYTISYIALERYVCCSTAASSAVDGRHTQRSTAAVRVADGRRTTNITSAFSIEQIVQYSA